MIFKLNMYTYIMCMYTCKNNTATSIQGRKLIKGGNYSFSKVETVEIFIQGGKGKKGENLTRVGW